MPARRKVVRIVATEAELAARELRNSCAPSSPTPRNTAEEVATAAPTTTLPRRGSPEARNAAAVAAPRRRQASRPCTSVATNGARRAAGVAETVSARPVSSSARV